MSYPTRNDSFKRTRTPEQVALAKLNTELSQLLEFSLALDALGDDLSPQYFAQQVQTTYQRPL